MSEPVGIVVILFCPVCIGKVDCRRLVEFAGHSEVVFGYKILYSCLKIFNSLLVAAFHILHFRELVEEIPETLVGIAEPVEFLALAEYLRRKLFDCHERLVKASLQI